MNMPMITQFQENQKTMSSREIADLTEIRHASTLELKLKHRLTLAEQALAEVP